MHSLAVMLSGSFWAFVPDHGVELFPFVNKNRFQQIQLVHAIVGPNQKRSLSVWSPGANGGPHHKHLPTRYKGTSGEAG